MSLIIYQQAKSPFFLSHLPMVRFNYTKTVITKEVARIKAVGIYLLPGQFSTNMSASSTTQTGAVFTFNSSKITSQVGFSFISSSKACQYIDTEVPLGTGLNDLVSKSKDAWNSQVLSKITTTETNQTLLGLLYTSLYGMHLLPS